MEANTKQQQLTFDKGITNVPSDAICSDNTLADSVGMVYENGEHKVIQTPADFITSAVDNNGEEISIRILYVHKLNNEERYIAVNNAHNYLVWGTKEGTVFFEKFSFSAEGNTLVYTENTKITSIGKTLIINNGEKIEYFLWKQDKGNYERLGNIPEPKMSFCIGDEYYASRSDNGIFRVTEEVPQLEFKGNAPWILDEEHQEEYNDVVVGMYRKLIKKISEEKLFSRPFLIRFAVELYDGTYTKHSNPILMLPSITANMDTTVYEKAFVGYYMEMVVRGRGLAFKGDFDYSDWSDIVKNVVVFASEQVDIYDTVGDQSMIYPTDSVPLEIYNGIYAESEPAGNNAPVTGSHVFFAQVSRVIKDGTNNYHNKYSNKNPDNYTYHFLSLKERNKNSILGDIAETSIFYKLFEAGIKADRTWKPASSYIKDHVLENITTQDQLSGDYYVHAKIGSSFMTTYNNRLLLSGIKRGFYEGFSTFLPYDNNREYYYTAYTFILTPEGTRVVNKNYITKEKIGMYYYYPDPRAYKVIFFLEGRFLMELNLEEHKGLNGAYFLGKLPDGTESEPSGTIGGDVPTEEEIKKQVNTTPEDLYNQIYNSEVNNPFVFTAEGNITVGSGRIIGMSTITQALSQGQFGQYPLIIFSDEGIWAASTGNTGLFTAVHPMSREVCNNPASITQTDGAVFFTSEKGLMVVAGSEVRCVSEQLSGREDDFQGITKVGNFSDYLRNCFIAYDYRDSLLWIFNRESPTDYCYIYSIKTGTFARYRRPYVLIDNVVNNYPDYLIQATDGKVYSLTERTNINDDEQLYEAAIITRPMKLENALALKSIRQIRHITDMQGTLRIRIFASNNLRHWAELHSLRGTPWKYFRFRYDFQNLRATDRFSGSIVVTQERRTDKLR